MSAPTTDSAQRRSNRQLLRQFDWRTTPLGPRDGWPVEMHGALAAVMHSALPTCTLWGPRCIQIYNDACTPIFGDRHPMAFGAAPQDAWPRLWRFLAPRLEQVRRTREPLQLQRVSVRHEGAGARTVRHFDFTCSPVLADGGEVLGFVATALAPDLPAPGALAERARLQAMTELAGGVAHDFNNFLMVILGNLDTLASTLPPAAPEQALVGNAIAGAERAIALTAQLLTYARRKQDAQTARVDWPVFLAEVEGLLTTLLGDANRLSIAVAPGLPACELQVAPLTSALLNLAANARDAMPDGGTLTLEASPVRLDRPQAARDGHVLPSGRYVQLRVADTGTGIPANVLPRIFEAFFTTKPPHAGSGLGLAMVRDFVRRSGGDVQVASRIGAGSEFRLLFPSVDDAR